MSEPQCFYTSGRATPGARASSVSRCRLAVAFVVEGYRGLGHVPSCAEHLALAIGRVKAPVTVFPQEEPSVG